MASTYKLDTVGRGDKNNCVLLLQEIPATEKAVIDYQTARIEAGAKLGKADGIVGPKTWEDLLGLAKV